MEAVLDAAQNVVAAYRYDPFGVLLAKTGSFEQPYGFSTKRYNAPVGMVQYEFRNYWPEIGLWDRRDPLGEAGGLNLYAFVGNNPVNWVDPWGLAYAEYYAVMFGVGGGLTGAALGGSGGAAICSPSGPGAAVCALVGGKGGAVAGTALGTAFGYALGSTIDTASLWWPILFPEKLPSECDMNAPMGIIERVERHGTGPGFQRHAHGRVGRRPKVDQEWAINEDGTAHDGNYTRIPKEAAEELRRRGFRVPDSRYPD